MPRILEPGLATWKWNFSNALFATNEGTRCRRLLPRRSCRKNDCGQWTPALRIHSVEYLWRTGMPNSQISFSQTESAKNQNDYRPRRWQVGQGVARRDGAWWWLRRKSPSSRGGRWSCWRLPRWQALRASGHLRCLLFPTILRNSATGHRVTGWRQSLQPDAAACRAALMSFFFAVHRHCVQR